MLNINTSETLFFHPLLLSGISSVIIFEIRNRLVLLKIKSLNLTDQVLTVRLIRIILMELNFLQDFSTDQITQIKEKLFLKKLVTSNVLYSTKNDSIIVETFLSGSNGLNDEENACIIESTIEYIITAVRFITPLL